MSVYIRQNAVPITYKAGDSWTILSQIEQGIKNKIEAAGTPLSDWDVQINRGILTGLNEAFIISSDVRNKLISEDPKSAEIIRPILRGRDIEKDSIHFSDLYLIALFPSKNYDIEEFPAIKNWLINGEWVQIKTKNNPPTPIGSGKMRLMQSGSTVEFEGVSFKTRKKTSNKWFETQDSIKYWDNFNEPKILFSRISGTEPKFALDLEKYVTNDTGYIITGEEIEYLKEQLINPIFWFAFNRFYMGGGVNREFKVNNLLNLPIPKSANMIPFSNTELEYILNWKE
ncbi:TaqI-like C-terminal specificity domain-containing protein [Weissella confusa]|uniref:site-specific DNA-methyltransferase (adenine-specific) n=2 Tax=Weissella confusa TaxID=1583 RepID=A0AAE2S835_WEICO|nr:TaqI-like C-terminal specificity domain-containing protein [Weissella confusa]MBJ7616633.1 hypothetical protein [Weissella confusa]MBJ7633001.1 hypothetical protein [Weissella confusa]MBJ7669863.1 hypothetical protein [Weissella confusa]MBJ7672227.1 hypothetical protein [Weissella confusa]MCS9991609.1 hypothetical protein [Weissella confusa]